MAAPPADSIVAVTNRAAKARFGVGLVGLAAVSAIVWLMVWVAIVPPLFGWSPVAVMSGSMEPLIDTGDIVVVAPYDGEELAIGTVIVFDDGGIRGPVTHRIVDMTPDGDYVTHGDANGQIDSTPVPAENIVGVGRMLIPGIGRPLAWIEAGRWVLLAAAIIATALALWASRWALLDRFNPWSRGVKVPAVPGTKRRLVMRLSPIAVIVVFGLVATVVTATRTKATFAVNTGNTLSSFVADILQPPSALGATGGGDVTLSWTITPDTYASGHRIYRAATSGGPYTQIAQTSPRTTATYLDSPAPGTYYYVARAYTANWESANSNEVSETVAPVALADSWQAGLAHTAGSGSDRVLVFIATNEQQTTSSPSLTSVSYGGQMLTLVSSKGIANGCCTGRTEMWILGEAGIAAASGTTITPTWSSTPNTPLYSHAVFKHVDQTSPVGATTTASVAGDTPNPIPVSPLATTNGDFVVAGAVAGEVGAYSAQNGFTLGLTQATSTGGTTAHGSVHKAANGSNETVSMLFNPTSPPYVNRQVVVAAVLNVAP